MMEGTGYVCKECLAEAGEHESRDGYGIVHCTSFRPNPGMVGRQCPCKLIMYLCICLFPFSFTSYGKNIFYFLFLQGGSEPNSLGGGKTSNPQHDLSILPLHQPNCTNER